MVSWATGNSNEYRVDQNDSEDDIVKMLNWTIVDIEPIYFQVQVVKGCISRSLMGIHSEFVRSLCQCA